jgi:hypothetical protein
MGHPASITSSLDLYLQLCYNTVVRKVKGIKIMRVQTTVTRKQFDALLRKAGRRAKWDAELARDARRPEVVNAQQRHEAVLALEASRDSEGGTR